MIVIVDSAKQFENKKQALWELAFCHYPVTIEVNGERRTFEWFSDVEKFFETLDDDALN